MSHSYSSKQGTKRYRYYVCIQAQKRGWNHCPTKSIPAHEIEQFVVDQIQGLGRDPKLISMTLAETQRQVKESLTTLATEQRWLEQEASRINQELLVIVNRERRADLSERLLSGEQRLTEICEQRQRLREQVVDEEMVVEALGQFDELWATYCTAERAHILNLLIEKIEYDGDASTVCVTYRPTGFQKFANELEARNAG